MIACSVVLHLQIAYLGSIDAQLRQSNAQLSGSQLRVISGGDSAVPGLDVTELEVATNGFYLCCILAFNTNELVKRR